MEHEFRTYKKEIQNLQATMFNIIFIILGIYGMVFEFSISPKTDDKKIAIGVLFGVATLSALLRYKYPTIYIMVNLGIAVAY